MTAFSIEKIAPHHAVEGFDCGSEALNRYLIRFALANQRASTAQTYLGLADGRVIGFYTLVVGEIAYDDGPERLGKGLARHPIPVMLLARLAVSRDWQGCGLGAGLLKDAMRRTMQAADIAGIRALAVHAKDDKAVAFYQRFDFLPSPTDPLHYFLLLKDLRKAVSEAASRA
jgi:GNAT superfamily N-acetyltransferase